MMYGETLVRQTRVAVAFVRGEECGSVRRGSSVLESICKEERPNMRS